MPEQNTLIKAKCLLIVHCEHQHYSGHEDKHLLSFEDEALCGKLHKIQNITQVNRNLCNFPLVFLTNRSI